MPSAGKVLGERVTFCGDCYEAVQGADGLVVLTEWQQFRNPDFQRIAGLLKHPVLFDGRNLYDPDYLRDKGLEYHCIGRLSS
jgi:UDPglucose 6-dehydrogenase